MRSPVVYQLKYAKQLLLCGTLLVTAVATHGADPSLHPDPGSVTPAQRLTAEEVERDRRRLEERAELQKNYPEAPLTEAQRAEIRKWSKAHAAITLADNGGVHNGFADGGKFSVFLDDEKYPVSSLVLSCDKPPAVELSPVQDTMMPEDSYPIVYRSVGVGTCMLRNKDFSIRLIVRDVPEGDPSPR